MNAVQMFLVIARSDSTEVRYHYVDPSEMKAFMMRYYLDPNIREECRVKWVAKVPVNGRELSLDRYTGVIVRVSGTAMPVAIDVVREWEIR